MLENFKLTYATMFNPPEELHTASKNALATVSGSGERNAVAVDRKIVSKRNSKTAHRLILIWYWGSSKRE